MAVGVWSLPDSLIREVGSIVKMLYPEVIRQSSCFHFVMFISVADEAASSWLRWINFVRANSGCEQIQNFFAFERKGYNKEHM